MAFQLEKFTDVCRMLQINLKPSGQQRVQTGSWGDQGDGTYRNPVFTIAFGKWTGDRLGFFCWNEKEEKGHIDVDWFKYDYDGPKALTMH